MTDVTQETYRIALSQIDRMLAAMRAIRAGHDATPWGYCQMCLGERWPCATVRELAPFLGGQVDA